MQLAIAGLRNGMIKPSAVVNWTMAGVLDQLRPHAVAPLFDQMLAMDSAAYPVGLDLMGMYVHGTDRKIDNLRPQLWHHGRPTPIDPNAKVEIGAKGILI